jgi:ATP-binding cassette subfamily B protein
MSEFDDLDEAGGADEPKRSSAIAALALLATRLGIETDEDQIKRRFSVEAVEPTSATLVGMATEMGLEAQVLKVTFGQLPELAKTLPAILRGKEGQALVLEDARSDPTRGTVALIRDPIATDDAVALVEEAQLTDFWEGEVILVKRRLALTDEQQPFGLRWLFGQVLREKKLFKDIGIAALVNTVFTLAPAFMAMILLDRVLTNHSYATLHVVTALILIFIAFDMLLGYLRRVLTQVATTRIDARLNLHLMDTILKLPMEFFEHEPTGRTLSKVAQMWQIRHFLTGQLFGALIDAVPLLGIVPALIVLQWQLAIMVFVLAAIIALIVYFYMRPIGRAMGRVIEANQKKNSHLVETLYGMKTIKSLSLEGRRRKEWDRHVADAAAAQHDLGLVANFPQTFVAPFQGFFYIGSLLIGTYLVMASPGTINPGVLVAFAMLAGRLSGPLVKIATLQQELGEVQASIGQLATVLNAPKEEERANGLKLPVKGEVVFKDLKFRYSASAPYALDGITFTVPEGKMLGIMGRSGSGKTTVTRLLQRLNSSYEGQIKIDGMDLREMDLKHLRTNIGVVPQENFLFSGTIRDNIAMAKPNASFMEVVRAAQLAGAEEFIERLPRGYDTFLEEGATNLSGGQRQRLAIARALLINPAILILDEATSALDAESEAIVNANLRRIAKGRTVISISHRLSMLVEADAIMVLERGKIYDIGTHDELLSRCDIYRHMWYQQNRHADPRRSEEPLLIRAGERP